MAEELTIDTHELDGFAELLDRFPVEVQNKMVKQSLGAGAAVFMLGVIQKLPPRPEAPSPHSTASQPGALAADIHAVASSSGRTWFVGAGPTMAYLLRWLEYGHQLVKGGQIPWTDGKRRRGGTGRVIGHVPAYPALRPAFDTYWQNALHAFSEELQTRMATYWNDSLRRVGRVA